MILRARSAPVVALMAVLLLIGGCSGGGDAEKESTTTAPSSATGSAKPKGTATGTKPDPSPRTSSTTPSPSRGRTTEPQPSAGRAGQGCTWENRSPCRTDRTGVPDPDGGDVDGDGVFESHEPIGPGYRDPRAYNGGRTSGETQCAWLRKQGIRCP